MPDVILTANNTGLYILGSGDTYFLAEGVTHSNTLNGELIEIESTGGVDVFVSGTMVQLGDRNAIESLVSTTGTNTITVAPTGSILANSDYRAIIMTGDQTIINNAGYIAAGTAIELRGDSSSITNTGILASNFPLADVVYTVVMSGDNNYFNNSGTITGRYGIDLANSSEFINTGTVSAQVVAVNFTGSGTQIVSFVNTGEIATAAGIAVNGGEGAGSFVNLGMIAGDVLLQGGDDVLENSGVISGAVNLGTGNNMLINTGAVSGDIVGGTGVDIVESSGDIIGDVSLTLGSDVLRNAGDIIGLVDLGSGNDRYLGGSGAVQGRILGGDGNDLLVGGAGQEEMLGGIENDTLLGNSGEDVLRGEAGNDLLTGGDGFDDMFGGEGADTLFGGDGDDFITGGAEKDFMLGGAGADFFVFEAVTDSAVGTTFDVIGDFTIGDDIIDLSAISGSIVFVGESGFTGSGGPELAVMTIGSVASVAGLDLDGDRVPEMEILIFGVTGLTGADFGIV